MQTRNAANVLPEPVGAEMRASRPARITGQPWIWGSVGAPKRSVNHSAMRGSKAESTADSILGEGRVWGSAPPLAGLRGAAGDRFGRRHGIAHLLAPPVGIDHAVDHGQVGE